MSSINQAIANELGISQRQVDATVALLDDGATVPFIARYRKEVTGSLDDSQLRQLDERLRYRREMEDRRTTIIETIRDQGQLTDELLASLSQADTKGRLEDLYLPYKPKRRTKGQIAREAGLEPLADALFEEPDQEPEALAGDYLNQEAGIDGTKAALDGARYILMERFAEDADLLARLRDFLWQDGQLRVQVVSGKEEEGARFRDYFDHREPLKKVPSHRALAIFRGRNEGVLQYSIEVGDPEAASRAPHPAEGMIAAHWGIRNEGRPADPWLGDVVRWTWRVKLSTHLETDLMGSLRERAESEAIQVFASNLKDLLMAAPAGKTATIGLDPGLRTGVKVAIVDGTGRFLDQGTIHPHSPQNRWDQSIEQLAGWCRQHGVGLVAIGNGTASRETDRLVADLIKRYPELGVTRVMVNEAGASVYSASEYASRELPELDVTIRGAVSIARRLQDPLAELVKIEPKSIGVGQYQHDVSQVQLARTLDAVIEDCVNAVGVDLNTASVPLLTRVAGLNTGIAENIIRLREQKGMFSSRRELLEVSRLGAKTFEQAAGFLRIMDGEHPLDASAVHPEAYGFVEALAQKEGRSLDAVIGDHAFTRAQDPEKLADERFGEPTVRDILNELEKPGRDPRPEFQHAQFREGVETLADLEPGMKLEGNVTNVTHFGAFVDIGVHQDGLVHISALSNEFVKDPRDVVRAGDVVTVKVLSVDKDRKRIELTMRMGDEPGQGKQDTAGAKKASQGEPAGKRQRKSPDKRGTTSKKQPEAGGAMAEAFARARQSDKQH
ncbi:Tex family protein [Halomonadaceae bacterium KBTZ08]